MFQTTNQIWCPFPHIIWILLELVGHENRSLRRYSTTINHRQMFSTYPKGTSQFCSCGWLHYRRLSHCMYTYLVSNHHPIYFPSANRRILRSSFQKKIVETAKQSPETALGLRPRLLHDHFQDEHDLVEGVEEPIGSSCEGFAPG